ncbi:CPBP family intramembrane metalloprotease [Microbacterium koreense]
MRSFAAAHPVALPLLIAIVAATIYVTALPFALIPLPLLGANSSILWGMLIVTAFCVLAMRLLYPTWTMGLRAQGFGRGLLLGWPAFVSAAILLTADLVVSTPLHPLDAFAAFFVWVVLYNTLVALVEETFLRGIVLPALTRAFSNSHRSILWAVLVSSVVFGLGHAPGMIGQPWTLLVAKVVWATALGIFLAAVFVRSGNLWSVVLLHMTLNVTASTAPYVSYIAVPFQTAAVTVAVCTALGVYGLWLIRPSALAASTETLPVFRPA